MIKEEEESNQCIGLVTSDVLNVMYTFDLMVHVVPVAIILWGQRENTNKNKII